MMILKIIIIIRSRVAGTASIVASIGLAVAGGAGTTGCMATAPHPTVVHASLAQDAWPGTTVADLLRGEATYARKCSPCHSLHDPTTNSAGEWPAWVRKMGPRAKLSGTDQEDILRYLVVLAEAPN